MSVAFKQKHIISDNSMQKLYEFYNQVKNTNEDLRFLIYNLVVCDFSKDYDYSKWSVVEVQNKKNENYVKIIEEFTDFMPSKDACDLYKHIYKMVDKYESKSIVDLSDKEIGMYKVYRGLKNKLVDGYDNLILHIRQYNSIHSNSSESYVYDDILKNVFNKKVEKLEAKINWNT